MIDVLTVHYRKHGRAEDEALTEAQQVVALIAQDQGGRPIYLPRGDRLRQALVARQIYHLHNGRNTEQLADRFGMTVRSVQRIYAEQRALKVQKLQGRLFPD
jgi:Mor family transcriptional regulator